MNDFWLGRETDEVIKVKYLGEKGFILSNRSISSTRSPSLSLSRSLSASRLRCLCQRMPRKAVCLFSLGGMSESTEGKDERRR